MRGINSVPAALAFVLLVASTGLVHAAPALEERQPGGTGTCEYGSECDDSGKNCMGAWICNAPGNTAVCVSCTSTGQSCTTFHFPSGATGCGVN